MEEISGTGTTENSSVSKQAARNRKVIKYRKRTYLFHLPNHNSVSVSKGSKVNTRTVLGTIHTDSSGNTVLHFQLRKETAKLNPELWLGR